MKSDVTIIAHDATSEQIDAFKAFGKALKVKLIVQKELKLKKIAKIKESRVLKQVVKDINLIKQGKLKARPIEDLLNEL
ncbi:MAG: hypothetical protein ABI844_16425 [Saprospiraceae bacterium]